MGVYSDSSMQQYHDLLRHILANGTRKTDRTGTGTISVFGYQMRFDLRQGFPLLTTKKVHTKSIIHELLWFIRGETNIKYLTDNGVTIWNEWANENGDLGDVYGKQWRSWATPGRDGEPGRVIDQLQDVLNQLKNTPDSRRMIVSAWNPADVPNMALPPCHLLFQFYVSPANPLKVETGSPDRRPKLSCQLYQRSADVFLGVPFNIASYALLTMMVAQECGYEAHEFVWTGGDTHLYLNHLEQVETQLSRDFRPLPTMRLNPEVTSLFDFQYSDFTLENYNPHPAIKAPVAV